MRPDRLEAYPTGTRISAARLTRCSQYLRYLRLFELVFQERRYDVAALAYVGFLAAMTGAFQHAAVGRQRRVDGGEKFLVCSWPSPNGTIGCRGHWSKSSTELLSFKRTAYLSSCPFIRSVERAARPSSTLCCIDRLSRITRSSWPGCKQSVICTSRHSPFTSKGFTLSARTKRRASRPWSDSSCEPFPAARSGASTPTSVTERNA